MFTKAGVLALCAAASFNGATAAAHHRHHHPKREIVYAETDTVIVTEYETHTVYAGEEPTVTAAAVPTSAEIEAEQAVSTPQEPATAVVVPTTTEAAPAPTTPTTLATLVKPSSAAVIPVVSQAAVEIAPAEDAATSTPAAAPTAVETTTAAPVAVETTTSAAPASTTAATPSTSGGKRGAAYNDIGMLESLLGKTNAISWMYNWNYEAGDVNVDIAYYPTMWGEKFAADWPAAAEAAIAKGTEVLFSFNEPDNYGQANMLAPYAAAKHQEWMNPYAGQAKIGAPSISSSQNANQGIDWLNQFFDACAGKCQVDFCNTHWYGPGGDTGAELFLTHLQAVRDVEGCQGKPVWVTEFKPEGSETENETFLRTVIEAMESSDYDFIEKYSYFFVSQGDSYLMSSATELNALGNIYAGLS